MRPSPKDSQLYFCRLCGKDVVISQRRFPSNRLKILRPHQSADSDHRSATASAGRYAVSDPLSVREYATRFLAHSTHTGPHVVAATLDPSQRNFNAVQEYLFERGLTAVDLLSGAIEQ